MKQSQRTALGVDLGGTKIRTVWADATGAVRSEAVLPTPSDHRLEAVTAAILDSVRQVRAAASNRAEPAGLEPVGLGIGVPGVVSADGATVVQAPNLGWRQAPLRQQLQSALGLPVRMENDANLAAWGEYWFGGWGRSQSLVYIGVGTGVGGGLILDGRIYRGSSGGAAEIGHLVLEPTGPPCALGHPGCLEAVASGSAIGRSAREAILAGRGVGLLEAAAGDLEQVDARTVVHAYRHQDPEATLILNQAAAYLGMGLATVVNLLNPELVVLGGGVADALGPELLEMIEGEYRRRVFPALGEAARLVLSRLGGGSGALGAAALALHDSGD